MGLFIFERVRRLTDAFSGLLGNRIALFGLEMQEEIERQVANLTLLLITFVLTGFALLFATLALLVIAWQNGYLLPATCLFALLYGLLALAFGRWLWRRIESAAPPFSATRAEFDRDRVALFARQENKE